MRLDKIPEPSTIKGRFVITAFVDDVDKAKEEIRALLSAWARAVIALESMKNHDDSP